MWLQARHNPFHCNHLRPVYPTHRTRPLRTTVLPRRRNTLLRPSIAASLAGTGPPPRPSRTTQPAMFGSPVRQGLSPGPALTSPPLQHRGPAFVNPDIGKENVDTEVLPGSPMVSGAGTSGAELLRAKSTVMQEQARLKRFKMLLDQVEQEVVSRKQGRAAHAAALAPRGASVALAPRGAGAALAPRGASAGVRSPRSERAADGPPPTRGAWLTPVRACCRPGAE